MKSVRYEVDGRIATITLDRPDRLNAIDHHMPREIRESVARANDDDDVHVIVLTGAGRAFCSGYDLKDYAEATGENPGVQSMPWDPTVDSPGRHSDGRSGVNFLDSPYSFTSRRYQ